MDFETAYREGRRLGAGVAEGQPLLALWCKDTLPYLHPGAAPKLVYAGACARGIDLIELARMGADGIDTLMWEG